MIKSNIYKKNFFRFLILCFCVMFFALCNDSKINCENLLLSDKLSYEYWEKMILRDSFKYHDVISSFNNYVLNDKPSKQTIKRFNKWKNKNNENQHLYSDNVKFASLKKYRAMPSSQYELTSDNVKSPQEYVKSIANVNSLGEWKNIGPFGNPQIHWSATGNGAIQYLRMHPQKANVMYACSRNGGLWKTIDYGHNWTPETDYFNTNNTSCIDISKTNNDVMYLGAAEDEEVWFTEDSGNIWHNRSSGLNGQVFDIAIDPLDPKKAIVATSEGIFYTDSSGLNWTKKISGFYTDLDYTDKWEMIVVSNDMDNIDPVFYYSINRGEKFIEQRIISHLDKVDRFYMAIHQYENSDIELFAYGLVSDNTPTRFIGLYKSKYDSQASQTSKAFNFTQVKHPTYNYPNGPVPLYMDKAVLTEESSDYYGSINPYSRAKWISDFYVSPSHPNRILSLREKFWGSEDGGVVWDKKPSYGGSNWADNRYITTNVLKDSVFWCNDGGIWSIKEDDLFPSDIEIQNSGLSKEEYINSKVISKNGNICVSESTQMDVSMINKGVFISGGQDIGQIFVRNGRASHVASADVYRARIKPTDDSRFITGSIEVRLNGSADKYSVYDNIEADPFCPNRIYGFTNKNISQNTNEILLVRSKVEIDDAWQMKNFKGEEYANAGGHSWEALDDNWEIVDVSTAGIVNLTPGSFEQSKAKANLAFLADETRSKLFVCENLLSDRLEWKELINAPKANIYRLATCSNNSNFIVLATDIGVFVSKDRGESWLRRANIPVTKPKQVYIDRNMSEGIYVLDELTVYYIDENFVSWQEFNKGLPLQNCSDMRIAYFPNGDSRLYMSKYGRGVWVSPLYSSYNKSQSPIADFTVFGNDKIDISEGDFIRFKNLSLNAESIIWTFKNKDDIITVENKDIVNVQFNNAGYYSVSLKATKESKISIIERKQYVNVKMPPADLICSNLPSGLLARKRGIKAIRLEGDTYFVESNKISVSADKVFELEKGKKASIFVNNKDSKHSFYIKVYVDFNMDGDFDDTGECIASSGGQKLQFTSFFDIPDYAILNQNLRLRVVGVEANTEPEACMQDGVFQYVDVFVLVRPKPVVFTSNSVIGGANSVLLNTEFQYADNITEYGFVYSVLDSELNINNSNIVHVESALSSSDKYEININSLEYNHTYYYRPFLIDKNGIHYGEKQSFTLEYYNTPEGKVIDKLFIQYGLNDFDNEIEMKNYLSKEKFNVEKTIEIINPGSYKFRMKIISQGNTYYSNCISFQSDKKYCEPFVANSPWYKRISDFTLNDISNKSNNSEAYTFFSDIVFNLYSGEEYPIKIVDSYKSSYYLKYLIYIDFNNDGDFDDYHEKILDEDPGDDFYEGMINIPNEGIVYDQVIRMRVIAYDGLHAEACMISDNGQIEDYSVIISQSSRKAQIHTSSVDEIGINTAVANFEIIDLAYPLATSVGICWSENENPTILDQKNEFEGNLSLIAMSLDLSNLKHSTSYYLRSFIISAEGIVYGEQLEFTTLVGPEIIVSDMYIMLDKNALAYENINVRLSFKPINDVIISIANDNNEELRLSEDELVFTGENWNIPQYIKISIVDELIVQAKTVANLTFDVVDEYSDDFYRDAQSKLLVVKLEGLLEINDVSSGNVYVFPNPARGKIYISGIIPVQITVCNMSGTKLIYNENVSSVDISNLNKGVYLVYIISGVGIGYVKKIIVY